MTQDSFVQYGHMVRVKTFPCLYYYELSHGYEVKLRRYCIPVITKNGHEKIIAGETAEETIRRYVNSHLRVKPGRLDRKLAAQVLIQRRGVLKPEVWGLSKFVNLGEFDPEDADDEKFVQATKELLKAMMG